MPSSGEISRAIYEQLGAAGLAARTRPEWDAETMQLVRSMLSPGQQILDLGCGYGRIAIPLVEAGFEAVGLDISPLMLQEAQHRAASCGVNIPWIQGDLCNIPCRDSCFDVVLCLWLTFHELLEEREQLTALKEMIRVLRPGGWALLDGPPYHDTSKTTDRQHAVSFSQLMASAGIRSYELFLDDCPGRPRQFLRFRCSDADQVPATTVK